MKAAVSAPHAGKYHRIINLIIREGTGWMVDLMTRMKYGNADWAEIDMLQVILPT